MRRNVISGRQRIHLDCDTGIDDALALMVLLNAPGADLVGIGTVSGNVSSRVAAENTLSLLALAGRTDIPVAVGAHDPLAGEYDGGAPHVHGDNGLGGVVLAAGPEPIDETAAELLVRLARQHPGELDVVAIGPLTNVALALGLEPELPRLVRSLTIMGGAVWVPGNITAHAEANIANDAEAARLVLSAGFAVALVPLDVTQQHAFGDAESAVLAASDSPLHHALGEMLQHYIGFYEGVHVERHAWLHDPLAAAIATGLVAVTGATSTAVAVDVDGAERGRTAATDAGPAVRVVTEVDADAAVRVLERILERAGGVSG